MNDYHKCSNCQKLFNESHEFDNHDCVNRLRKVYRNCQTLNCCHKIDYGKYCEDCKFDRAYVRGD